MNKIRSLVTIIILSFSCLSAISQIDTLNDEQAQQLLKIIEWQNRLSEKIIKHNNSYNDRKVHFKFMPGMGRTPDYGFSLGAGAAMTFYTSQSDTLLTRSTIPLIFRCKPKRPFAFKIICTPEFYFNKDRIKLNIDAIYHEWTEYYFGIGYSKNHVISKENNVNTYTSKLFSIAPNLQIKIGDLSLYAGLKANVWHERVLNPGSILLDDDHYIASGGDEQGLSSTGTGIGPSLTLDTRDNNYNSTEGVYFDLHSLFFSSIFGGNAKYSTLTLDYRQYKRIAQTSGVFAWNILSNNKFGTEIPFMRYATIGEIIPFRGYYGFQYRDKSILTAQVEYRYMFNFGGPASIILNRFGFSVWSGLSFMGKNPIHYDSVLPELGAGLKMLITKHAIMRFDCGYGTADNRFLWYIGMTQSF